MKNLNHYLLCALLCSLSFIAAFAGPIPDAIISSCLRFFFVSLIFLSLFILSIFPIASSFLVC